mmetsp:Transcript_9666/g.23047  ORF Transcript_9666/g.23047 Transcript_9666/m.23047 type:complete len:83 (-) Transcript_9666:66-314(-)
MTIPKPILAKIYQYKVQRVAITQGRAMNVTSKIHTFKDPVDIPHAVDWLVSQGSIDASLVFLNDSSLSLEDGKYLSFDELRT